MCRLATCGVSLLIVPLLAACGGGREALTIYSGRDEALVGPLLERFAEEKDVDIDVRYGDSAELALLIEEEGEASPADVYFSQSPGAVEYLAAADRLAPLEQAILDKVPEDFRGSGEDWVGVTARERVIVYNEELVAPEDLPDSVLDLPETGFADQVGLAPANGSFQDFVTAMRQTEGEDVAREWLEGMASAGAPTFPDNNSIVDAVSRGEIPMGLVNHYYNFRFLEDDPSLPSRNGSFAPGDIGNLLIASPIAILRSTDQESDAQALISFLLNDESMAFFAEETFEYPLVEGVEPSSQLEPLDQLPSPQFNIQDLGGGLQGTVEMIEQSGLL
ncbi:MAG: extracellular solute-binding protein [Actinobacteria bacterium]|nr:extracellular solute-binding protein [Actinomycetota bacterium]